VRTVDMGRRAGALTVRLVRGDRAVCVLRLGTGQVWPVAPVLTVGGVQYPLTLSADRTRAVLDLSVAQVETIARSSNRTATLDLGDIKTWRGNVVVS
jgi:hypothetical protein